MGAVDVLRMLPWPGRCPSQRIACCAPHGLKAPAARLLAGRFFFSADPRLTCAWGDPCCAPLQALSFDGGCRSLSPPDEASRRFCSDCVHLFRLAAGLLAVQLIACCPPKSESTWCRPFQRFPVLYPGHWHAPSVAYPSKIFVALVASPTSCSLP